MVTVLPSFSPALEVRFGEITRRYRVKGKRALTGLTYILRRLLKSTVSGILVTRIGTLEVPLNSFICFLLLVQTELLTTFLSNTNKKVLVGDTPVAPLAGTERTK